MTLMEEFAKFDCRKFIRDELLLIYVGMFFWNDEVSK